MILLFEELDFLTNLVVPGTSSLRRKNKLPKAIICNCFLMLLFSGQCDSISALESQLMSRIS